MQVRGKLAGQIITLDFARELGAGGEARVLPVCGNDTVVAKIYHQPDYKRLQKLEAMLTNPPEDPAKASGGVSIAWPLEILCTPNGDQHFLGFLMPRVTGLRPLMGVYNPQSRKRSCPFFTYAYLMRAARNLASAVSALHAANCVIGDVNESNTLVSNDALITIVDADSFQIRDSRTGETYRCPVGKGEFTPPELQGEKFTDVYRKTEHDLFGLGVLLFQLLMEGTHPFFGRPLNDDDSPLETRIKNGHFPHGSQKVPYSATKIAPPFAILNPELQALFIRCFEEGHVAPQRRPDARSWQSSLAKAELMLVSCSANRQHVYSNHLQSCPWCERKKLLQGRDPFPSINDIKAGAHLTPPPKPQTFQAPPRQPAPVGPIFVTPSPPAKKGSQNPSGQDPFSRTAVGCLIWFLVLGAISGVQNYCSQHQLSANVAPRYYNPGSAASSKRTSSSLGENGTESGNSGDQPTRSPEPSVSTTATATPTPIPWNYELANAAFNRGVAAAEKGDYQSAIDDYSEAIRLKPDYADAFDNRAWAFNQLGQYDKAVADSSEAIRLKPTNMAYAFCRRAWAFNQLKQYDKAIADYSEAIRLKPDYVIAYRNRANCYEALGKAVDAKRDRAKADGLEKGSPSLSVAHLGGIFVSAFQTPTPAPSPEPSVSTTATATPTPIPSNDETASAAFDRGHAAAGKGDYQTAIKDYSEAIRLEPDFASAFAGRGYAYYELNQYDKAVVDYSKEIRLDPNDDFAFDNRGYAYYKLNQYDKAVADYSKEIRLDPNDASAYRSRARCYDALGKTVEAKRDRAKAEKLEKGSR